MLIKNTHEAIIDEESFKIAQRLRQNKCRNTKSACESHQLSENAINKIATDEIHRVIDLVKNGKEYFVEYVNSLSEKTKKAA